MQPVLAVRPVVALTTSRAPIAQRLAVARVTPQAVQVPRSVVVSATMQPVLTARSAVALTTSRVHLLVQRLAVVKTIPPLGAFLRFPVAVEIRLPVTILLRQDGKPKPMMMEPS